MTQPLSQHLVIAEEIRGVVARVRAEEVRALEEAIVQAERVFVCGAGRSLLMMKAFAMRLMHLGLRSYVVGEVVTPAIAPGDLIIAGTGSGRTRTTNAIMEEAAVRGARTAVLTAHPECELARDCDVRVEIPARIVGISNQSVSAQPAGSLFEQGLLVVCDGLVMSLMQRLGAGYEDMRSRHTKLE